MKRALILIFAVLLAVPAAAKNIEVKGEMESAIDYEIVQNVKRVFAKKMVLSYVLPAPFKTPTYSQEVSGVNLRFIPEPTKRRTTRDARGNSIVTATWNNPYRNISAILAMSARANTGLGTLKTQAPFPLKHIPGDVRYYLKPTELVQADDPDIRARAQALSRGVKTEFDAVQRTLTWMVDNMRYVNPPKKYDALYSFKTGKGNCQNYSHLAAAILRVMSIPTRIVNGVTLNKPYSIKRPGGRLTFKMGQGRHSWVEVWFPDLGWVPMDPQDTMLFTSNRYVRVEVGIDNEETKNDGLMRWIQVQGKPAPRLEESINASFGTDRVELYGKQMAYGPRKHLLHPRVEAQFKEVVVPLPPPPKEVPPEVIKRLVFDVPFVFGNLDFPEGVDFAFPLGPAQKAKEGGMAAKKSFLVETAEYVTTKATQYAQTFVLRKPVKLKKVGLALHRFGGDGTMWVEIRNDGNGAPGDKVLGWSEMVFAGELTLRPGYRWVDFDFAREKLLLQPGAYWIALGFTGTPIMNWFYTYGKPVGPPEGTRYKSIFEKSWSGALAYEFNYRVKGLTARMVEERMKR